MDKMVNLELESWYFSIFLFLRLQITVRVWCCGKPSLLENLASSCGGRPLVFLFVRLVAFFDRATFLTSAFQFVVYHLYEVGFNPLLFIVFASCRLSANGITKKHGAR